MVQVDFFEILELREQANEFQFEFALPKNIYKRLLRLSGVTKQTISNVSLELGDWLSYWGQQSTFANSRIKYHGRFLCSFLLRYWTPGIYLRNLQSHTLSQFPAVKTAFVFASLCSSLSFSDSCLRVISSSTSLSGSLWSTTPPPLALSSVASFAFTFLAKVLNLSHMDLGLTMNSFWQFRLSATLNPMHSLSLLSHVSAQTPPPLPLWLVIWHPSPLSISWLTYHDKRIWIVTTQMKDIQLKLLCYYFKSW